MCSAVRDPHRLQTSHIIPVLQHEVTLNSAILEEQIGTIFVGVS